jgi:hypothetical protein
LEFCDSPLSEVDHGKSYAGELCDRIVGFVKADGSSQPAAPIRRYQDAEPGGLIHPQITALCPH